MDWYSWLSRTSIEPTLVYEYGLVFARNELQGDDLTYFNHEFLQSLGISVAKHRLEILKLARKDEARRRINGFSRLVLAVNKTRKLFTTNIGKWAFHKNSSHFPVSKLSPYRSQWSGALRKNNGAKQNQKDQKGVISSKNVMWSGPLDRRVQEKFMVTSRSHSVSGPLDGKIQERLTYPNWSPMVTRPSGGRVKERLGFVCRSPALSGPMDRWGLSPKVNYYNSEKLGDDDGVQSLWSLMFQDMKPT